MCLIQTIVFLSVLSPSLSVPAAECIETLYEKCKRENPDHACAVFYSEPMTPHPIYKYKWIEEKDQCSPPFGTPYYIVAIPKKQTAAWIVRSGDGGFENWRFDPSAFNRLDKRITIK
ncbi:hypothetical protein DSO57_1005928 [Entomophthora muscae]|uniref:Uncharacterized protein n=1 Tax=Entomophthora muscae TaxID=34485 RepID=A0ACC2RYV5_9FUNG|nr:hypothetical protein DSO57_1005928 [Entomophthora muscae]